MNTISIEQAIETTEMFSKEHLDVRTITMGISLLDTMSPDVDKLCKNVRGESYTRLDEFIND